MGPAYPGLSAQGSADGNPGLYTKSGGTNLAYQNFGSGRPVITIPPLISNIGLGCEQELDRRVLDYFGRHTTVILWVPGTDPRHTTKRYSWITPPSRSERWSLAESTFLPASIARSDGRREQANAVC